MSSETIYTVDWQKLVRWLLPLEWRKKKHIAWLYALISPIITLHEDFLKYRQQKIYRLTHNSQVCYLQAVLNDAFDRQQRRIYIQNGRFIQPLYFYTPEEERPVYFGTHYLYSETDFTIDTTDFIVFVPIELQPNNNTALESYLNDMKALINSYKLASKTYLIKWID